MQRHKTKRTIVAKANVSTHHQSFLSYYQILQPLHSRHVTSKTCPNSLPNI